MKQLTDGDPVTDLTVVGPTGALALHKEDQARVSRYLESARARNTIRGYKSSFQLFAAWCERNSYPSMPTSAETVAAYLTDQAGSRQSTGKKGEKAGGLKVATLRHHLAAIHKAHRAAGQPSPIKDNLLVAETLKGIASIHGSAKRQKNAILTEDVREMLRKMPVTLIGTRDRVLLLLGFAGAFRRSELVSITANDLQFGSAGVSICIRKSKTDQAGEGRDVAIPYGSFSETCPVAALQAWLEAAGIKDGPVFRSINRHGHVSVKPLSDHSVNEIVKSYVGAIQQDASLFGGHSLRAGFVTTAARKGVPEWKIMQHSGHKSIVVVQGYIRRANKFTDNAALSLGL